MSHALVAAAAQEGYAVFSNEESERSIWQKLMSIECRAPIRKKALEMAALFGSVTLNSLPLGVQVDRLVSEGIVKHARFVSESLTENTLVRGEIRHLKPWVLARIHRNVNARLRAHFGQFRTEQERLFSRRQFSMLYDNVAKLSEDVDRLIELRVPFWDLLHPGGIESLKSRLINIPSARRHLDLMYLLDLEVDPTLKDKCLSAIREITLDSHLHPGIIGFGYVETILCLHDLTEVALLSSAFELPFATRLISARSPTNTDGLFRDRMNAEDVHGCFKLCQIELTDIVRISPTVESVNDLIRLRNNPSLARFQEVLREWSHLIKLGDTPLITRMRKDIALANKELKKLPKWYTVDKWCHYTAVPMSFIPILSTLHTIVATSARWHIEENERKHGWIALGM